SSMKLHVCHSYIFSQTRGQLLFLRSSKNSRNASNYIFIQRDIRSNRSKWMVDLNIKSLSKTFSSKRELRVTSQLIISQNPMGFLSVSTGHCSTWPAPCYSAQTYLISFGH